MGSVDGFYFYFDEWVLILLMVDEWGLLMVDEWGLLMVKWVFFIRGSCRGGSSVCAVGFVGHAVVDLA